ncbi:hypothetical protein Golomagni_03486 [Golovinomyces magnicellulatus]|nr:hypothetical protein Golomagni_03486 [Golovinomyces magnicellulatus]
MALNQAQYKRLPRSFTDLPRENIEIEFKEKSVIYGFFSLILRRARRLLARVNKPIKFFLFLLVLLGIQLKFNGSFLEKDAPPFTPDTQERIFIAANIIDGDVIRNWWGPSLLSLVQFIGPERTYVSIYGGPTAALSQLADKLKCEHKIVSEEQEPVDLEKLPRMLLSDGNRRIKRISFLAEVRNKALEPLKELESQGKKFDKILFINDVYFSPTEALRLLWGTNVNENRKAEYKAACAADFVTSWKYYDTFATRDAEGYSLGLPIFPWFSTKGEAVSRKDVLAGRDSVRVKSCWGGMVSFDARYFMSTSTWSSETNTSLTQKVDFNFPVRFRSEPESFWDASECCLVHADIMFDTGIYLNPYVRTAYSEEAFAWIPIIKRFERLISPIQWLINQLVGIPHSNYRRTENPGQIIDDWIWINYNSSQTSLAVNDKHLPANSLSRPEASWKKLGYYKSVKRVATRGGYCGVRQLMVLKEKEFSNENNGKGGENWDNLLNSVPPLDL